jgi:hypothetical protein
MHAQKLLGRALACLVAAPLLGLAAAVPGKAQVSVPVPAPEGLGNADASLERVIGEVTATNLPARQIALKIDAGGTVTVILQDKTMYLRVPPGETNLTKAVKIAPADIGVGDRVLARGRWAEDRKSIPAVAIIVMTKADLAKRREREVGDWQKRGVAGSISALNAETKEISLSVRSSAGTRTLIIQPSQETIFHRYAPDSVQFVQAKPSSFDELTVGDALRILGDKNADGTRIKAEEIVSGSFRNVAGIVSGIDAAAGEITMTDLQSRRRLSVRVTSDTMLRRMPPAKPAAPANRPQAGGSGPASGAQPSAGRTQGGAAPAATTTRPQAGGSGTASGGQGAPGAGGLTDPQGMPVLSLRELKRDEAILVLCTVGAEPSRVTAIVVVAGVERLLGPALQDQTQIGAAWNFFDISVP